LVSIYTEKESNMQSLKVNNFIDKVLDVLHESIKLKGVQVLNYVPSTVEVFCVPSYLESIMLNLVTNAIKYSDPNKDQPKIIFTTDITDDFVVLNVKDNGLGIDLEKHKDSIFGLYKTFHRNSDARGVGLYLTKNQIENMGGKIELESTLNFGTTFKIYFKKG
jgi:signal transduction histidine kinase